MLHESPGTNDAVSDLPAYHAPHARDLLEPAWGRAQVPRRTVCDRPTCNPSPPLRPPWRPGAERAPKATCWLEAPHRALSHRHSRRPPTALLLDRPPQFVTTLPAHPRPIRCGPPSAAGASPRRIRQRDSTLAGNRNTAFLRVSVFDEVRAVDYGLDARTLTHRLAFSGERWRESREVRRRMARAFTGEEFQDLARKHSAGDLARKVFEALGPADRTYAPSSPWQLDLTACEYAWGRVVYWPGQRYPDRMGGMRLKSRIGAWAYYYDDKLF